MAATQPLASRGRLKCKKVGITESRMWSCWPSALRPAVGPSVESEAERGRALLIYPREELGISRIASDPGELMRVYELGRGAGLRALERVRAYLGE